MMEKMINHNCFADKPEWTQELRKILEKGIKCEMETLAIKV